MTYCDAHLHIVHCTESDGSVQLPDSFFYAACTCAHDRTEFKVQEELIARLNIPGRCTLIPAFGMHPQNPLTENADFMEQLLQDGRIQAVGEAGFDFYTPEFAAKETEQEKAWQISVELAEEYRKPLVVHCRKGIERIYRDSRKLKNIPAVLFHSFAGNSTEARSLLRRGIHAYFCEGKQLLNGNKKAASCIADLPHDCIILETDAPFQTLKSEKKTLPCDIIKIYQAAASLCGIGRDNDEETERLFRQFEKNFSCAYSIQLLQP